MQNTRFYVPFIYRKCPKKQVDRDGPVSGGLERDWEGGVTANGHKGIFVGVKCLELGCGDSCRLCELVKNHGLCIGGFYGT